MHARPILPFRTCPSLRATLLPLFFTCTVLRPAPVQAQAGVGRADSLTTRDKALINTAAEQLVHSYANILNLFSRYDASSASDVEEVRLMVAAVTQGDDRLFTDSTAIIEDNINPAIRPGATIPDLAAPVYLNDFFTQFHGNTRDPVAMNLADYGEPHATPDGTVVTSLLYDVTWLGTHDTPGETYAPHQRVVVFRAMRKGVKDWDVRIATDSWSDPARPFKSYRQELEAERARSQSRTEAILKEYEDAAKQVAAEAARSLEERTKDYEAAIDKGDALLNDDPEGAMLLYQQAAKLAPVGRLDHIIQSRKAQRALEAKNTNDRERALDTLSARLVRQVERGGFSSVVVSDFTEVGGAPSGLGAHLASEVAGRMARMASHFTVSRGTAPARGGAAIGGGLLRTGGGKVSLTATIQDKRGNVKGQEKQEFPMPEGFANNGAVPVGGPDANTVKAPGIWSLGVSVGLLMTRTSGRNDLTDRFTKNGIGPRVGIEVERMGAKGNHRFATGMRWASFKCSTAGDEAVKRIEVNYLQVPLLYRLFTDRTAIGRFGLQAGVLADVMTGALAESYTPQEYIDVSFLNAHASAGLCYETNGPGRMRISANVAYEPMVLGGVGRYVNAADLNADGTPKEDPLLPSGGPKLGAISFAVGVMFRNDTRTRSPF